MRDRILETICAELRMKPDDLANLPPARLTEEIRRHLPEHARNWTIDVSPTTLAESIERLKKR